jgi:tRNA A37 methylthiotransferase MiaB
LDRLANWRRICPELVLRSTFIVGFPGETEADFEELLDFLQEAQLDRVGCFAYSPVDGAAANALPNPVPEALKQERLERFMAVQAEISRAKLAARVGQRMIVLVDEVEETASSPAATPTPPRSTAPSSSTAPGSCPRRLHRSGHHRQRRARPVRGAGAVPVSMSKRT